MANETIRVSDVIPAPPKRVYQAWMSSREHAGFTGAKAAIEPRVGGRHNVHDGYIHGWNLALEPGRRIVQAWRTTEFPVESPDSVVEVRFAAARGGTRVTIVHSAIPRGQGAQYKDGWRDFYLAPLKDYFAR